MLNFFLIRLIKYGDVSTVHHVVLMDVPFANRPALRPADELPLL